MLWIGITGSIGTGKTTFSGLLRKHGHVVLDADELSKASLEPFSSGFQKVLQSFGEGILDSTGRIDRAAMAQIVFSDKEKLEILESIVHPEIKILIDKLKDEHRQKKIKFLFYDVPLLFEKDMEKTFDLVVMVTSTIENQMERIRARNRWTEAEISKRLAAQLSPAEKESKAHILIRNDGDLANLENEVVKFLDWLGTVSQNPD